MPIIFNDDTKTFYLQGKDYSYVFCINKFGFLNHLHYGARIAEEDLSYSMCPPCARGQTTTISGAGAHREETLEFYMNECPTYGRSDYRESMLSFDFPQGERVTDLIYESHRIYSKKPELCGMPYIRGGETLVVKLVDRAHKSAVELYYTVYEDVPALVRHAEIYNCGEESFRIDRAYSFCLDFPAANYDGISFYGAHLRERMVERAPIGHGVRVIDSKRGVSSGQMNPSFILAEKSATEDNGAAYGVNLVYSGDFSVKVERGQFEQVRLTGGINEHDFCWRLDSGEKFVTPEVALVYSSCGLGGVSRAYHDLFREHLIPRRFAKTPRPIVVNSWEALHFNFDETKIKQFIDVTAGTGIDTFVLDDGWFGERNDDTAGLGDWRVNYKKLPCGIRGISDYAHKKGLKFGIWIEPEMVNENSDLFREHPDYIISANVYPPCEGRRQLVLDLSRNDVRDEIVSAISSVIKEGNVDYVKWDMNRCLSDNYSAFLAKQGRAKELHHRYVLGVYDLCERLINAFPNVFFEGCASGGCRFDAGMLYYFSQIWTSDNTDAGMRALIQYGTSYFYPVSSMTCHISSCPNGFGRTTPLKSREDIARLGVTGVEHDLTKASAEELNRIAEYIASWREDEALVLDGDLYRLSEIEEPGYFSMELVSKDRTRAEIVVMKQAITPECGEKRLFPRGLDGTATYFVRETGWKLKGNTLAAVGLPIRLSDGDFVTAVYHLEKL